jgi:hypothetical protein
MMLRDQHNIYWHTWDPHQIEAALNDVVEEQSVVVDIC